MNRAHHEDIDQVLALYRACALHGELNADAGDGPSYEAAEHDLDLNGLYVARQSGEIVAAVSLLEAARPEDAPDARACVLARLCVHPKCQRQGLGRSVMTAALSWARRRGYTRMNLMSRADDAVMLGLCHKVGFRNLGIRRPYGHAFVQLEHPLWKGRTHEF
ncbi:GNAT family N-acetyltransferase [Bacillota bacterium Meth-B3]